MRNIKPISFAEFGNTSNILLFSEEERKLERVRNKELFRDRPKHERVVKRQPIVGKHGKKYLSVFINGQLQTVSLAKLKTNKLVESLPSFASFAERLQAVGKLCKR